MCRGCAMLPSERIETIMTESVLSIDASQGVSEVLRYFSTYPIHHLPVVEGSRVIGMVSTADVMKLEHYLPRSGGDSREFLDQRLNARSLVRGEAITIRRSGNISQAASLMAKRGIHSLAVVDEHDNLVGIVTTTDIMSAMLSGSTVAGHEAPGVEHAQRRLQDLEELLRLTERYLTAGQDVQLHARLTRAVEQLRSASAVVM
jgi:CBS domain-containing membrane protein